MFNWNDLPPLTKAEERLEHDSVFGWLDYPKDPQERDQHFRDGSALLRTLTNQTAEQKADQTDKIRKVIEGYIHFAVDQSLRKELEELLATLPTAVRDKEPR